MGKDTQSEKLPEDFNCSFCGKTFINYHKNLAKDFKNFNILLYYYHCLKDIAVYDQQEEALPDDLKVLLNSLLEDRKYAKLTTTDNPEFLMEFVQLYHKLVIRLDISKIRELFLKKDILHTLNTLGSK